MFHLYDKMREKKRKMQRLDLRKINEIGVEEFVVNMASVYISYTVHSFEIKEWLIVRK